MSTVTYELIEPLVESAELSGDNLRVRFRCPDTGFTVDAGAPVAEADELLPLPTERAGFLSGARSALLGMVRRPGTTTSLAPSEEARRAAVVAAFQTVRHQFRRDAQGRWVAFSDSTEELTAPRPLSADFVAQSQRGPVVGESARGILVRVLSEVAQSDSRLDGDEQSYLEEFIGIGEEAGEQVLGTAPLTGEELAQVTEPEVRETMLMLAWGIALTDEELTASEQRRLGTLASDLQISDARAAELKRYAQLFLLEAALEPDGSGTPEETRKQKAIELGRHIGLGAEETRDAVTRHLMANV